MCVVNVTHACLYIHRHIYTHIYDTRAHVCMGTSVHTVTLVEAPGGQLVGCSVPLHFILCGQAFSPNLEPTVWAGLAAPKASVTLLHPFLTALGLQCVIFDIGAGDLESSSHVFATVLPIEPSSS